MDRLIIILLFQKDYSTEIPLGGGILSYAEILPAAYHNMLQKKET